MIDTANRWGRDGDPPGPNPRCLCFGTSGTESMGSRLLGQRGMFSYVGERDRMATIQVETIVTITVDRGMRDALRTCLRSEAVQLEHYEGVISGSDAQAAHAALARAAHLVEMFDQLGWADDDPRERYEITVALDSFAPWLRGHRGDLAESLADEISFLRRMAADDEAPDGGGHPQPVMIDMTHDELLGWRTELEAIDALLERLDSVGGVG